MCLSISLFIVIEVINGVITIVFGIIILRFFFFFSFNFGIEAISELVMRELDAQVLLLNMKSCLSKYPVIFMEGNIARRDYVVN